MWTIKTLLIFFILFQQNRPKSVKSKPERSEESKKYSDSYLLDRRKMKSDSLGASGHTTNLTRGSSGKGKDDDVKGKDVKKVTVKLSKDPKQTEKTTTTRPKLIVKTKLENNGNAKTEGCASKGDTASGPKPESGRTGARPKATNGSVNPTSKVKSLKKPGKDLASPVTGSLPSFKSANVNGELSNSASSPGEQNVDRPADNQPNSTTGSPQSNKVLKTNPDGSKDLATGEHTCFRS